MSLQGHRPVNPLYFFATKRIKSQLQLKLCPLQHLSGQKWLLMTPYLEPQVPQAQPHVPVIIHRGHAHSAEPRNVRSPKMRAILMLFIAWRPKLSCRAEVWEERGYRNSRGRLAMLRVVVNEVVPELVAVVVAVNFPILSSGCSRLLDSPLASPGPVHPRLRPSPCGTAF